MIRYLRGAANSAHSAAGVGGGCGCWLWLGEVFAGRRKLSTQRGGGEECFRVLVVRGCLTGPVPNQVMGYIRRNGLQILSGYSGLRKNELVDKCPSLPTPERPPLAITMSSH